VTRQLLGLYFETRWITSPNHLLLDVPPLRGKISEILYAQEIRRRQGCHGDTPDNIPCIEEESPHHCRQGKIPIFNRFQCLSQDVYQPLESAELLHDTASNIDNCESGPSGASDERIRGADRR